MLTAFIGTLLLRIASLFRGRGTSLHELDARTLADIGVDPSEIDSIEAERLGHAELTRLRITAGVRHA